VRAIGFVAVPAFGLLWASAVLGGEPLFQSAVQYSVPEPAVAVAISDLNGDQVEDVAVANTATHVNILSVLLGIDGDVPAAPVEYWPGIGVTSAAIGDLHGDQVPDIVAGNDGGAGWFPGAVAVMRGNGDGSFAQTVTYLLHDEALSVAIGDLNGDQIADLAAAVDRRVSILLGLGDGTFAAPIYYEGICCANAQFVAIADLNGDGIPDLVERRGRIWVWLGTGNARFADPVFYLTDLGIGSVAISDLNGDQVPDLATANDSSNDVSVLLGIGDGTFADSLPYAAGNAPVCVLRSAI